MPHTYGAMVFARWRHCVPHLIHASLGPPRVQIPNGIWIGSSDFARLTAESHYTLQWAALPSFKLSLTLGIWMHKIHCPLGPRKSST